VQNSIKTTSAALTVELTTKFNKLVKRQR